MKPQTPSQSRPLKCGNKSSASWIFLSAVAEAALLPGLHKLHNKVGIPQKSIGLSRGWSREPLEEPGEGAEPCSSCSLSTGAASLQELSCPAGIGAEAAVRRGLRAQDFVGMPGAAQECQGMSRMVPGAAAEGAAAQRCPWEGDTDPSHHGNHQGHAWMGPKSPKTRAGNPLSVNPTWLGPQPLAKPSEPSTAPGALELPWICPSVEGTRTPCPPCPWRCHWDSAAPPHLPGCLTWAGLPFSQLNAALSFGAGTWNVKRERETDRDYVQQGKYLLYKINTQLSKM